MFSMKLKLIPQPWLFADTTDDWIMTKKKDKDSEGEVVGNIINCKLYKSRFTKENQAVQVKLNYDTGLDRYYGLVDLALSSGVFTKTSTRITLPDGSSAFEKNIYENPSKYFTKEILEKLENAAHKEFKYGSGNELWTNNPA